MKGELPDEPLTAAAAKALDAARALAERPTDEQRLRMKAALLAKLGGTAATTAAVKATTVKATTVKATAVKAMIGLALVGGAVAAILVARQPAENAPSRRDPPPVVSAAPAPLPSASASAAPDPPAAPPPSAPASTSAPPVAAPAAHDGDDEAFRREVDAVRQAQLHMAEDEPTQALAVLRPWSTSTADPLRDERWAIQIEALCQIGTTSEGLRQRRAFLRALPSSPLASRVRGLCASADADPGF
jgi:hypothetical protein